MSDYGAIWSGPAGRFGIAIADDFVTRIDRLEPGPELAPDHPLAAEVARQLSAWSKDPRHAFDLPLAPAPTPFQRRFRAALCAVPVGETVTYGELARQLASAPRAVGGACGANPLAIVVPCHRVVAANGIGGYGRDPEGGSAIEYKRWLLEWERKIAGIQE
jgi:methylated-DNA-[protein]-cysteine S-methyltransferase